MIEILYGRNAVHEALRAGRRKVMEVTLAEGIKLQGTMARLVELARQKRIPLRQAQRQQIDSLVRGANHQGVIAHASTYPYAGEEDILNFAKERGEAPFVLLLDCLQDPQNLGTLLRTAEAVGVHGVLIPCNRAADISPAVSNASAGAIEHLRVARVTNLVRAMEALKEAGVWVIGVEDVPEALEYRSADLDRPLALVIGSEGEGLRRLVRERCDFLVRLPMRGQINSLNAAVAGSIILYEAWRQRERV